MGFTLAAINIPAGNIQVTIETDLSIDVPKAQTFDRLGPREERMDEEAGVFELETMEFEVTDTYEDYDEGFWFRLLHSSTLFRIQVQIDEGNGPQDFFYGELAPEETEWTEEYIGTPRIRHARFKCVNVASALFDLNMATFQDIVYAHSTAFDTGVTGVYKNFKKVIPVQDFIGCALHAAGLNGGGVFNTYLQYDAANPDLKFIDGSNNEFTVDQVWLPVTYLDINGVEQKHTYWNTGGGGTLYDLYGGDFRACLGDFLYNFGLYLRVVRIGSVFHGYLYQRHGRAYDTTVDMESMEKESTMQAMSPINGSGVMIRNKKTQTVYYWIHDESPNGSIYAPPEHLSFEVERNTPWTANALGAGPGYTHEDTIGIGATVGAIVQAVNFKYHNYYTGGTVNVSGTTQNCRLQHAVAGYNYWKLKTQDRKFIRRYYGISAKVGSARSFNYLNVFRRVSINDGVAAANYQASRVSIDPLLHEAEVEWVRE